MERIEKILAENIRRLREEAQLSQKDLALKAKISPITLNRIENLKQRAGSSAVKELAAALGVPVETLYQVSRPHQNSASDRAELIADIIGALPALNENELHTVLSTIQAFSRSAAD